MLLFAGTDSAACHIIATLESTKGKEEQRKGPRLTSSAPKCSKHNRAMKNKALREMKRNLHKFRRIKLGRREK